ncbi:histidine phosphatase family protein [Nereida sp. MMG025]|uniref:SixA phosphatase family protein n=1 Tax=Nereida sp. MMG025 TaxID=2909981 RepID=UPI001F15A8C5|nr:histidine phosphatase family protein [Nereida sp. MMG025]MCF6444261.1 histidine phosphatase family protein [Nereida sp. MMG025]
MKRLILMRHCKSDWAHNLPDIERPLNGRGRKSARALGDWLRIHSHLPDEIMCSSSTRTYETCHALGLSPQIDLYPELYLADAQTLSMTLAGAQGEVVLMAGHNPGIGHFAWQAVKTAPAHSRFGDYPTGATTVIDFDVDDWSALGTKKGTAIDFAIPRELLAR